MIFQKANTKFNTLLSAFNKTEAKTEIRKFKNIKNAVFVFEDRILNLFFFEIYKL